jgi:hypothetical protein
MSGSDVRKKLAAIRLSRVDSAPTSVHGCEDIYVGSVGCVVDKSCLRQSYNITHTLCVAEGLSEELDPPASTMLEYGIVHKSLGVQDNATTNIANIFEECFDFISTARMNGGIVLIYCFQGKSRSVTVACAYLMKKYSMPLMYALENIRVARPVAQPNLGFMVILRRFEKQVLRSEIKEESIY